MKVLQTRKKKKKTKKKINEEEEEEKEEGRVQSFDHACYVLTWLNPTTPVAIACQHRLCLGSHAEASHFGKCIYM